MLQKIPIIKNLSAPRRAIAITVGLLVIYELIRRIPLTFLLPNSDFSSLGPKVDLAGTFNFFRLGVIPAFTGFFLVEICPFFLPSLKTWRAGGKKGRAQLTKCSWVVSLLVAILNTYGFVLAYRAAILPNSEPFLGDASLLHQGVLGLVFVLGFVAACGLAELISRYGIGNGFAILISYGMITYMPVNIYNVLTYEPHNVIPLYKKNIMTGEPPNLVGIVALIIILIALYQKFGHRVPGLWRRLPAFLKTLRPITLKAQAKGKSIGFQLPYLPQGIFVTLWILSVIGALSTPLQFMSFSGPPPEFLYIHNTQFHLVFDTILVLGLSYLGYWLVSHPERIAHNMMGKITFEDRWESKVDTNAIRAILIFTLLWFLCHIPDVLMQWGNILHELIDFAGIIILIALVKDLLDQYRFLKKTENFRNLGTFDNVHFVTVLKGLFEAEGIRFCVQAFEYRRLFYFFEPLIKMRVWVDACDWEKTRELANLENVTII